MIRTRLTERLDAYVAGHVTPAEVVVGLERPRPSSPRTLEQVGAGNSDPRGVRPGTWEEIAYAHLTGRLSDEQYEELFRALTS